MKKAGLLLVVLAFALFFLVSKPVFAENQSILLNISIEDPSKCDVSIGIYINKTVFDNENRIEKVQFYNTLSDKHHIFVIEYWIEDYEGKLVKNRTKTSNLNLKSWTPKKSLLIETKVYFIKNKLISIDCNNTNKIMASEKMILVKKLNSTAANENEIKDINSLDEEALLEFNETESEESIDSEITQFLNASAKNKNQTSQNIKNTGSSNKITGNSVLETSTIYESSTVKLKKMMIYILPVVFALITITFILKYKNKA